MFKKKAATQDWKEKGKLAGAHSKIPSAQIVQHLLENDKKLAKRRIASMELLTFTNAMFYLEIDREAFSRLKGPERADFSDGMLEEIVDGLSDLWEQPNDVRLTVGNEVNSAISKLAPYAQKLLPEKDESPAGTLYWEYMKLLVSDYKVDHGAALTANIMAMQAGIELWKNVRDLLPESN